ncbi:MAG TPA: hypothetical protein VGH44_00960 [Candidatus Saccharimonadia bacterium]|jgi:hypothetical protein
MDPLERTLYEIRAALWTNALNRVWFTGPNVRGVRVQQLAPEAASLRARVEARLKLDPAAEAKAIRDLLPLPDLRSVPMAIPVLAELVRTGQVTPSEIERFMVTSEFSATSWRDPEPGPTRPQPRPHSRSRTQRSAPAVPIPAR